jgi:hypothetical protein
MNLVLSTAQVIVTKSAALGASLPAGSGSSRMCEILMRLSTASMLSFTLRNGSRILQRLL